MSVKIKGSKRLQRNMSRLPSVADDAMAKGVLAVAVEVFEDSQNEVPVEFRQLKSSGWVKDFSRSGRAMARLHYGTNYALVQHERTDYQHPRGGKAKYLEDPINRAKPGYARRVAAKAKGLIRRGLA